MKKSSFNSYIAANSMSGSREGMSTYYSKEISGDGFDGLASRSSRRLVVFNNNNSVRDKSQTFGATHTDNFLQPTDTYRQNLNGEAAL